MERPRSLAGERRGRRAPRLRQVPLTKEQRDESMAALLNKAVLEGQQAENHEQQNTSERDEKATE